MTDVLTAVPDESRRPMQILGINAASFSSIGLQEQSSCHQVEHSFLIEHTIPDKLWVLAASFFEVFFFFFLLGLLMFICMQQYWIQKSNSPAETNDLFLSRIHAACVCSGHSVTFNTCSMVWNLYKQTKSGFSSSPLLCLYHANNDLFENWMCQMQELISPPSSAPTKLNCESWCLSLHHKTSKQFTCCCDGQEQKAVDSFSS